MNTIRLLSEFHAGSLTVADTWRRTIDPANLDVVMTLAAEAGKLADAAGRKLGMGGEGDTTRPRRSRWPRRWARSTSRTTCGRA